MGLLEAFGTQVDHMMVAQPALANSVAAQMRRACDPKAATREPGEIQPNCQAIEPYAQAGHRRSPLAWIDVGQSLDLLFNRANRAGTRPGTPLLPRTAAQEGYLFAKPVG
jgi:hypothetical protein